jgi:tetratricopeptide (TPR) repeat protein
VFTTHQQAVDWARTEVANLIPVSRQAETIGHDAITWKLAVALMAPVDLHRRQADLLPALHVALTATQHLGDHDAEAWILNCLAEAYCHADRPVRTAEFCRRALAMCAETRDWWGQWGAWHTQGMCYLGLERFSEAMSSFQEALIAARQAADPRSEGMSLTGLGIVYQHLESHDAAIDLHRKALAILSRTRSSWQRAWALHNLADAYCDHGRIGDAVDHYQQAQAVFREIGDRWREAEILAKLGQAQKAGGQPDAAWQSWHLALSMFEDFGDARADQIRAELKDLNVEEGLPS